MRKLVTQHQRSEIAAMTMQVQRMGKRLSEMFDDLEAREEECEGELAQLESDLDESDATMKEQSVIRKEFRRLEEIFDGANWASACEEAWQDCERLETALYLFNGIRV